MALLNRARTWLSARLNDRRAQLRLCLRVTVAAVLTFYISQLLHLPWALWAVLTAVIMTQTSVGKSLIATIDYMIGTLGGGIYSGFVGVAFLASLSPRFAAAPFTAVMVLLLPTITHASALQSAFFRVIEVAVGCAVSLAVSFLVFPQRAHNLVYEGAAKILIRLGDILSVLIADLNAQQTETPAQQLQRHVGDAFQKLAAINIEAARERSAYLHSDPDPQPLIDVTLRLRHDIVLLGRAATEPLPPFILERLVQPIEQFAVAAREFLIAAAAALNARTEPPPVTQIDTAFTNFSEAFAALRRAQLLQNLPTDTVERIFALGFCFEQMHTDLTTLGVSVSKIARMPKSSEAKKPDARFKEIA
jgi:uncharacterized membrane protein YccC